MQCNNTITSIESLLEKCRTVLSELTEERAELLSNHRQLINRLPMSTIETNHSGIMLKAIDNVILQVASYIDEHSA